MKFKNKKLKVLKIKCRGMTGFKWKIQEWHIDVPGII